MNRIGHARLKYPEIFNGEMDLFREKGYQIKKKGGPRRTTPDGAQEYQIGL
jgi:hypothetical protein